MLKSALAIALTLGVAITTAGVTTQDANAGYKSKKHRHAHHKSRTYSRRDYDRLPIRVTRPPNAGWYIYDNYPLWAARAFQPRFDR